MCDKNISSIFPKQMDMKMVEDARFWSIFSLKNILYQGIHFTKR